MEELEKIIKQARDELLAILGTVSQEWEETVEELAHNLDTVGWEWDQTVADLTQTLENAWNQDWWQEWEDLWQELGEDWFPEEEEQTPSLDPPTWSNFPDPLMGLHPYRPATPDHHPACQNCQHYHGFVYGGELLVCGMHPYGSETPDCPDWQGP